MSRLYWKFFLFLLLAQLTTVVGVSLVIWSIHKQENRAQMGVEISPPARSLVEAASATLQFGGLEGLMHLLDAWQDRPMPQVFAVNAQGQELLHRTYSTASLQAAKKLAQTEPSQLDVQSIQLKNGQHYLLFVPERGHQPPFSPSGPPPDHHDQDNKHGPPEHSPKFPLMPLLGGSIVSLLFAAILAWYFSKPINHLRNAFARASEGDLDTRIGMSMGSRQDALADLGRDFDTMAARLSNLLQSQTRLLHHVSHELRSPLARMQMAIGLARQSDEKIPAALDRIQLESERMDGLVGELLQLSRLESGVMTVKNTPVDLTALLEIMIEDAKFEAEGQQNIIQTKIQSGLVVVGELALLDRAIENVVRNAIKYSSEHGVIVIECHQNIAEKKCVMTISDQGPGVPEDELNAIFQPFVRSSHAHMSEGHGVGLAIAKQVIEAHNGKIYANNRLEGGLRVVIELPTTPNK